VVPTALPHPPTELQVETLNETAVRLMWKEPRPIRHEDEIAFYNVSFWPSKSDAESEDTSDSIARFVIRFVRTGIRCLLNCLHISQNSYITTQEVFKT